MIVKNDRIKFIFNKVLNRIKIRKVSIIILMFFIIFSSLIWYLLYPPLDFPKGRIVTIDEGLTLSEISNLLEEKSLIHSKFAFKILVTLKLNSSGVLAGDYFFEDALSSISLARRFTLGEFGIDPIQITIHEGLDVYEVASVYDNKFKNFDKQNFLKIAIEKEGYLFPDTYLFLPNVTEEQVIREMEENFQIRIQSLENQIAAAGKSLNDIMIMASIIEKEAWKPADQKLISGVLWKRLDIGMKLQVDSTFEYINGKNTYELTYDDLDIDSLYNTYKYKGLPIGPIANPGLNAIEAAINPESSSYLYYLADMEGNTYYANTYDGHKKNKALYMQ